MHTNCSEALQETRHPLNLLGTSWKLPVHGPG